AGVARLRAQGRPAHGPARQPRCRGGALSVRSRPRALAAARPGHRPHRDGGPAGVGSSRRGHLFRVRGAQGAGAAQPGWRLPVSRARVYLAPAAVILALLGAWELAARWDLISNALNIHHFLVPAPSDIAKSLWEDRSLLADDSWVTLREVLLGFLCALIAGVGFALVLHLSDTLRRAFYPLLVASQTIPPVAIAPILVVWFGFGLGPKVLLIALVCFFPVTVNTLDGLRSVDPQLITMMRTLGASRGQILGRVELPSALPFFFSGTKIAIAIAVIGAVFAEWAGASSALGHQILIASSNLLTARMFAAIVLLSVMAILLFALVSVIERRVVTWDRREGTRR